MKNTLLIFQKEVEIYNTKMERRGKREGKISRKGQRTEANKMTFHITDGLQ